MAPRRRRKQVTKAIHWLYKTDYNKDRLAPCPWSRIPFRLRSVGWCLKRWQGAKRRQRFGHHSTDLSINWIRLRGLNSSPPLPQCNDLDNAYVLCTYMHHFQFAIQFNLLLFKNRTGTGKYATHYRKIRAGKYATGKYATVSGKYAPENTRPENTLHNPYVDVTKTNEMK